MLLAKPSIPCTHTLGNCGDYNILLVNFYGYITAGKCSLLLCYIALTLGLRFRHLKMACRTEPVTLFLYA